MTLSAFGSPYGVVLRQSSLSSVTRKEPLKLLPPDFVIALTTPPVKRPNSAEMPEVDVVVSAIASSMKRLFGVPRMLSWMLTPFTVKRLSNDWAPEMTVLPVTALVLTPGERRTDERSVRATGSFFVRSDE